MGTRGATRGTSSSAARAATPTAIDQPLASGSTVSRCRACSTNVPDPSGTPMIVASWPTMMVRPSPNMKPTWTAAGMNRDTKPRRRKPMRPNARPARMASAADSDAMRATSPAARTPTSEAEMAAVEDVGLTMSWRQVPSSPYPSSPPMAANRPCWGGRPAIWAYAIACGTTSAHTVSAATRSRGRPETW